MLHFSVRPATIKDLPIILGIEKECFVAPWNEKEVLYELNENPVSHVFVGELGDQIIGYYDYWITFDSATIAQIAVLPQFRRQGYGKAMLKEIIDDCKANRVLSITLEVRKNNISAQNLYKSQGFEQILIKEKYYTNGDDAVYMVRKGEIC